MSITIYISCLNTGNNYKGTSRLHSKPDVLQMHAIRDKRGDIYFHLQPTIDLLKGGMHLCDSKIIIYMWWCATRGRLLRRVCGMKIRCRPSIDGCQWHKSFSPHSKNYEIGMVVLKASMGWENWSCCFSFNTFNTDRITAMSPNSWGSMASIILLFAFEAFFVLLSTKMWLAVCDCVRTLMVKKEVFEYEVTLNALHLSRRVKAADCSKASRFQKLLLWRLGYLLDKVVLTWQRMLDESVPGKYRISKSNPLRIILYLIHLLSDH